MSDPVVSSPTSGTAVRSRRGQSFVEFALVLPMLLVLLLGIADFGRVFSAGISIEAAARNAAEVGALERLRNPPPADPLLHDAYYRDLHRRIAETACSEMDVLPPPDDYLAGPNCQHLTAIAVCIQDGKDTRCGVPVSGIDAPIPSGCQHMSSAPTPPWPSVAGTETLSHSVEVTLCYQFSTLWNLDLALPLNAGLTLGDIYLERVRSWVVDCPPSTVSTC